MRKEAVYTVLLNATLFKGMRCFLAQDPRYIRFSVIEGSATTHYNLRVRINFVELCCVCADCTLSSKLGPDGEDGRGAP